MLSCTAAGAHQLAVTLQALGSCWSQSSSRAEPRACMQAEVDMQPRNVQETYMHCIAQQRACLHAAVRQAEYADISILRRVACLPECVLRSPAEGHQRRHTRPLYSPWPHSFVWRASAPASRPSAAGHSKTTPARTQQLSHQARQRVELKLLYAEHAMLVAVASRPRQPLIRLQQLQGQLPKRHATGSHKAYLLKHIPFYYAAAGYTFATASNIAADRPCL